MIKYFCDKCGKETSDRYNVGVHCGRDITLCKGCFKEWIATDVETMLKYLDYEVREDKASFYYSDAVNTIQDAKKKLKEIMVLPETE